ncbi:hypothetical protein QMO42_30040, partial [Pseudomonas aeruginosa]|uniref:ABC transporter permease subunit n=1 Tax=Pseudomonas aeruginosa TaxID=287 RepID=UPI003C6E31B7|nr:hypothetical protein [Pseudomonas aeruginosa]
MADLQRRHAQWTRRGAPLELLTGAACHEACGTRRISAALLDRRAGTLNPMAYSRGLMTFILIVGGIDLSVGSVLALAASAVSLATLGWGWGVLPAAMLGMACATLAGCVTGSITVAWRIPSFIVSLGVLEMARGLAYQMTDSRTAYI